MPIDSAAERVTLECTRQSNSTIWDMARERFQRGQSVVWRLDRDAGQADDQISPGCRPRVAAELYH